MVLKLPKSSAAQEPGASPLQRRTNVKSAIAHDLVCTTDDFSQSPCGKWSGTTCYQLKTTYFCLPEIHQVWGSSNQHEPKAQQGQRGLHESTRLGKNFRPIHPWVMRQQYTQPMDGGYEKEEHFQVLLLYLNTLTERNPSASEATLLWNNC